MSAAFDPYHKWLGIPPEEQPADFYRLLTLAPFESDPEVIEGAADRQMAHVRTYQTGQHSAQSQKILNELAAAKLSLLHPQKKNAYDAELRRRSAAGRLTAASPTAVPVAALPVRTSVAAPAAEPHVILDMTAPRPVDSVDESQPSPAEIRIAPAQSTRRLQTERWRLAAAAAGGIIVGFLLGYLAMRPSAIQAPAAVAAKRNDREDKRSGEKRGSDMTERELATLLKSIKAPSPLGVVAEKLVIHNAHSGAYNNVGTLQCNVRLFAGGREVWSKEAVSVPWAPNEDRSVTLALPVERFDRVRVEITKWEKLAGGLAEIRVLSPDGRNLALGCPAIASGVMHGRVGTEHITDGVTTSATADVGAWLLPPQTPGWVEVDLSLPRSRQLAGATANKLVIWNQHNGPHNNHGTSECEVRLYSQGREVWKKTGLAVPWSPNEDRSIALELPPTRFDLARVEISKWEKTSGGLAEIQIFSAGRNLALDCPALASGVSDPARSGRRVTDGILSSQVESVGYWLLPEQRGGWVEIDLACLDAKYGAACRQLGLALALGEGNWQRGLLWLARGDDPTLRRLALADAQEVYDTPEQLALGDAWWDLAQQAEGDVRRRLLGRACWRYRQALNKLREVRKLQVQARVQQALADLPERNFLYFMPESELKIGWASLRETPVSVGGVRSHYGLWLHPGPNTSSLAAFRIGKGYRRLRGAAAMNDTAAGTAATALTFRVVGDGRELWKSQPLKAGGSSQSIDVDVSGIDKLELWADCPGPNNTCHAVWVEPRLER